MALPNDLVRVRIGGIEKNLGRAYAESTDGVEILEDESVRNSDGSLRGETGIGGRPLKPRVSVDEAAQRNQAAAGAAAASAAAPPASASPQTPAAGTAAGQPAANTSAEQKEKDK